MDEEVEALLLENAYNLWCYAHRIELACKDALSRNLFKDLTEMLLRLYNLYSKSQKKSTASYAILLTI